MKFSHLSAVLTSLLASVGPIESCEGTSFQEDFAGQHALSRAIYDAGFRVICRDVVNSRFHDILTPAGFLVILAGLRKMLPGGLYWCAPPCSSWVFLARGSTRRSRLRPQGKRKYASVRRANRICRRLVYLLEYCQKQGIAWCIEQPCTSLMFLYPPMLRLLRRSGAQEIRVDLGVFGAFSQNLGV